MIALPCQAPFCLIDRRAARVVRCVANSTICDLSAFDSFAIRAPFFDIKIATTAWVIALVFGVSIQRVGVYGVIFVIVLFGERSASPQCLCYHLYKTLVISA